MKTIQFSTFRGVGLYFFPVDAINIARPMGRVDQQFTNRRIGWISTSHLFQRQKRSLLFDLTDRQLTVNFCHRTCIDQ